MRSGQPFKFFGSYVQIQLTVVKTPIQRSENLCRKSGFMLQGASSISNLNNTAKYISQKANGV